MKERVASRRVLLLALLAASACRASDLPSAQAPALVEVDASRGAGERDALATRAAAGAQRTEPPAAAGGRADGELLLAESWRDVLGEVQGRAYALVYDEPDSSLRLDRSEITRGLVFVHPLEIASMSPSSLFATIAAQTGAGADSWFDSLVRGATEIHVAPGGEEGHHVARMCSSLPNLSARRKVLHAYAARDSIGRCGRGGVGEDDAVCSAGKGWPGWEVLTEPRGFSHVEVAIDEPLAGDMIPACSTGNPLHQLVLSFRAFQTLPPRAVLFLTIDDTPLISGALTPVLATLREGEQDPSPPSAGGVPWERRRTDTAPGPGMARAEVAAGGEEDGSSIFCDVQFSGNKLENIEGRCSLAIMLQPLAVGRHTAVVTLHSNETARNMSAVSAFTVVGGVLQERQGPAVGAVRHARTPVQYGKGHWVWHSLEVPELGEAAARVEADFKRHKRQILRQMLAENGLAAPEAASGGDVDASGDAFMRTQPPGVTVAEMVYNAEAAAHSQQVPVVVFPLPNTTVHVLDKVPITLGVRIALGWPLLSPKIAQISINIMLELDVPGREPNISYLGERE